MPSATLTRGPFFTGEKCDIWCKARRRCAITNELGLQQRPLCKAGYRLRHDEKMKKDDGVHVIDSIYSQWRQGAPSPPAPSRSRCASTPGRHGRGQAALERFILSLWPTVNKQTAAITFFTQSIILTAGQE